MCYTTKGEKCAVYGITSAYVSAGKSLIIANMAISYAQMNKKVLLVDGDLRCPVLHKIFKLDNKVYGFSDLLAGICTYDEIYRRNGGYENLNIISSGKIPPNPAELLASPNMKEFIAAMKEMLRKEGFGMKLLMEDLGFLDDGVKNLLKLTGLPGMDIWQFTANEMIKMNKEEPEKAENRAFYTGTHDNETLMGWIMRIRTEETDKSGKHEKAKPSDKEKELLRTECETEALDTIKKIYESRAALAMLQLQDVFLLGNEARMNVPGIAEGNWDWKVGGDSIEDAYPDAEARAAWFRELAESTGRI
jgi:hypothetical protein